MPNPRDTGLDLPSPERRHLKALARCSSARRHGSQADRSLGRTRVAEQAHSAAAAPYAALFADGLRWQREKRRTLAGLRQLPLLLFLSLLRMTHSAYTLHGAWRSFPIFSRDPRCCCLFRRHRCLLLLLPSLTCLRRLLFRCDAPSLLLRLILADGSCRQKKWDEQVSFNRAEEARNAAGTRLQQVYVCLRLSYPCDALTGSSDWHQWQRHRQPQPMSPHRLPCQA